jgi:hypothetical protein
LRNRLLTSAYFANLISEMGLVELSSGKYSLGWKVNYPKEKGPKSD